MSNNFAEVLIADVDKLFKNNIVTEIEALLKTANDSMSLYMDVENGGSVDFTALATDIETVAPKAHISLGPDVNVAVIVAFLNAGMNAAKAEIAAQKAAAASTAS